MLSVRSALWCQACDYLLGLCVKLSVSVNFKIWLSEEDGLKDHDSVLERERLRAVQPEVSEIMNYLPDMY